MLDVYSLGKKGIDYFKERLDNLSITIKNTYIFVPDDFESSYPLEKGKKRSLEMEK